MNKNFADWYRTVNIDPNDELLRNRWKGIETFTNTALGATDIIDLVKLFFGIYLKNEFRDKFTQTFQDIDSAFPQKCDVEISVLAGATLVLITEKYEKLGNLILLSLKAAAFNDKLPIVKDMYDELQSKFECVTSEIRENIIDFKQPKIKVPSSSPLIEKCKTIAGTGNWEPIEMANILSKYASQLAGFFDENQKVKEEETKKLKIFFEDSQILWWMTGEWSNDLNKPFKKTAITEVAIIAGKELSDMIQIMPGPFAAEAVLNKVLSNYSAKTNSTDIVLKDAIDSLEHEWKEALINKYDVNIMKEVTPILFAIAKSLEVDEAGEWLPSFKKNMGYSADEKKIKPKTLVYQMYLECMVFKCYIDIEG